MKFLTSIFYWIAPRDTEIGHFKVVVFTLLLQRGFDNPQYWGCPKVGLSSTASVSDIAYLWARECWLYFAIVMGLFNRGIAGFSIKLRMTTDLIGDALTMTWFRRGPQPELMVCLMSHKDGSRNNAPAVS